jgi:hypothetical protein
MPTPFFDTRSDARHLCWHSADSTHAWPVTPIAVATTRQNTIISSGKTPAAPLRTNSRDADAAKSTVLPIDSATRSSEPAAKSP